LQRIISGCNNFISVPAGIFLSHILPDIYKNIYKSNP